MSYIKENVAEKVDVSAIAQLLGLSLTATFLPFIIHVQWVTGPLVNALLILILFVVGIRSALVMCFVPSLMALAGGLLPFALAPVIPFIMLGNVIFILSVDYFYKSAKKEINGYWAGVFVGGALKYLFILFNANLMVIYFMHNQLGVAVARLVSWPQFATAVAGGAIAWVILKWLKRV
jgi:riboflavin transporter